MLEIEAYTEGQLGVENLWEEYKIMEIDVDADRQLTSQKRRREATCLDSFIEDDMTDSDSDDEVSHIDFSKWLSLSRERRLKTRSARILVESAP